MLRHPVQRRTSSSQSILTIEDVPSTRSQPPSRCVIWVKIALSASVPLMIAIFTVVTYIQQNEISQKNREQDQRIAEEQRQEDQRQADDSHYQSLYSNYIEDISNILYKHHQNETIIDEGKKLLYIRRKTIMTLREIDNERKSQLFLFLYENQLLPNDLSPSTTVSLLGADLQKIEIQSPITLQYKFHQLFLASVDLTNATFWKCRFENETTFFESQLYDTSFIGCTFRNNTRFSETIMNNVNFTNSSFQNIYMSPTLFYYSTLVNADFRRTQLYNVQFQDADLSYSNFSHADFSQVSISDRTSLIYADFRETTLQHVTFRTVDLSYSSFSRAKLESVLISSGASLTYVDFSQTTFSAVRFENTNLTGTTHLNITGKGIDLYNVVLPNGTWLINGPYENLVKNGDAEKDCLSSKEKVTDWDHYDNSGALVLWDIRNRTDASLMNLGSCCIKSLDPTRYSSMSQNLPIYEYYSLFVPSGQLQYNFSAYFGSSNNQCDQGQVEILLSFVPDKDKSDKITISNPNMNSSNTNNSIIQWKYIEKLGRIPKDMDSCKLTLTFGPNSTGCYCDNINVHVFS